MKLKHLAFICIATCLLAGCRHKGANDGEAQVRELPPIGFFDQDYFTDTTEVRGGENITGLLMRLGVNSTNAFGLVDCCDSVFDFRKMRAGNKVVAYYQVDSVKIPEYIVYINDRIRSTIFQCNDSLAVWTYDKPVTVERKVMDVTITSSLWNDMIATGNSPLLIMSLADIYAWTVNFFALQEGDRFRAIYEQRLVDDEVIAVDKVDFAIYNGGGKEFTAIRFDQGDKGNKYWNEKGESMKKAFLKAPLQYNRISSRFSYARKHPVTGKVRPHTAVDYAAPSGTPVHTIGDGVVTLCGWDGTGGGNRIKIRHANGYETCYMHLSKFASGIRNGSRVGQGQTIGYVGSTGRSTGPHLDFRVWKDGTPIDPLKIISPPAQPLKGENMDSLKSLHAIYQHELEQFQ